MISGDGLAEGGKLGRGCLLMGVIEASSSMSFLGGAEGREDLELV